MGTLDGNRTKVVITSSDSSNNTSEKLKFAMQNKITCVNLDWVYDSYKNGYALPSKNYTIKVKNSSSTPERSTGLILIVFNYVCL